MSRHRKRDKTQRVKTPEGIEIRYNEDGTVDEILVYDKATKTCLFHMEQMTDASYWIGLYGYGDVANEGVHVDMFTDGTLEEEPDIEGTKPKLQRIFAKVRL